MQNRMGWRSIASSPLTGSLAMTVPAHPIATRFSA